MEFLQQSSHAVGGATVHEMVMLSGSTIQDALRRDSSEVLMPWAAPRRMKMSC
jgi:hypothetical protein